MPPEMDTSGGGIMTVVSELIESIKLNNKTSILNDIKMCIKLYLYTSYFYYRKKNNEE